MGSLSKISIKLSEIWRRSRLLQGGHVKKRGEGGVGGEGMKLSTIKFISDCIAWEAKLVKTANLRIINN